jgi:hypothetical protein
MEILWMASAHDLRWGHFYGSTTYEGNLTRSSLGASRNNWNSGAT